METSEYHNIFSQEDSHPFYQALHQLVLAILDQYLAATNQKLQILDAGCGTGLLAVKLQRYGHVRGIDINTQAIQYSRQRGLKAQKASITNLPFSSSTFDLVVCIDVLYHMSVSNDLVALKEIQRVLKPGGILVVRVPANKWLRSSHDKHVHTRQRYGKKELETKLKKAHLSILRLSYVNMLFLVLAIARQSLESLSRPDKSASTISKVPSIISSALVMWSRLELEIIKRSDLPFGLGLLAVTRKPMSGKTI